VVEPAQVPIDPVVEAGCRWLAAHQQSCDPLSLALQGGEDFELLFTAPFDATDTLQSRLAPLPVTRIGRITQTPEVLLQGNDTVPLPWGFTHF